MTHGYRCNMPAIPIKGKPRNARDGSFAWTACNLWNSLSRCIQVISGRKVECFKNKFDKILAVYLDIPRCAKSDTHLTEMVANLIPCATTRKTELLDKK